MTRGVRTLLLLVALAPGGVCADVLVSEVAWMGTTDSASDEWIELHNAGSATVDLAGWRLVADDETPTIELAGSLAAGAYATLERTDDASAPDVGALLVYTGGLANDGERLRLLDASGALVDTVDGRDSWAIGGDNESKDTVQRRDGVWVTGHPTPGRAAPSGARAPAAPATAAAEPDERSSRRTVDAEVDPTVLSGQRDEPIILRDEKRRWSEVSLSIPEAVTAGTPFVMRARVRDEDGDDRTRLTQVRWSTGDGARYAGSRVRHRYLKEGSYVVHVTIERRHLGEVHRHEEKRVIAAREATVAIEELGAGYVVLTNTGEHELDLSHWHVVGGGGFATLPPHTYLLPGAATAVALETHEDVRTAAIVSPDRVVVARFPEAATTHASGRVTHLAAERSPARSPAPREPAPPPATDAASPDPTTSTRVAPSAPHTAQLAGVAQASGGQDDVPFDSTFWYWALLLTIGVASAGILVVPGARQGSTSHAAQGADEAVREEETFPAAEEFTLIEEKDERT
ncbi:PKD domain-containing protein [Patescibacteria group bacterium]|jgi:hypothetical protein|nr:PKD domain-containing protein [Patescibacteria group bacterium]